MVVGYRHFRKHPYIYIYNLFIFKASGQLSTTSSPRGGDAGGLGLEKFLLMMTCFFGGWLVFTEVGCL